MKTLTTKQALSHINNNTVGAVSMYKQGLITHSQAEELICTQPYSVGLRESLLKNLEQAKNNKSIPDNITA